MAHRINERNTGNWTLDGEPKKRKIGKKSFQFAQSEIDMLDYLLHQIVNNIKLEVDGENQSYIDNGNILIKFDREKVLDIWSIQEKLKGRI